MRISLLTILFAIFFVVASAASKCRDKTRRFNVTLKKKKKKKNCKWVAKRSTNNRCKKRTTGGTRIRKICPLTCGKCIPETSPPIVSPVSSPTTEAPNESPTAQVTFPPTNSPVSSPPTDAPNESPTASGKGCCSNDYKVCVDWCGETYDSCMSCGSDVGWLPNGAPVDDTCGARWMGCGDSNDTNHSGCCDGLTCQRNSNDDWMSCKPSDSNSTPTSPPTNTSTQPPVPPTSPPTGPPTGPPTQPPVPPTSPPISPSTSPPTNNPTNTPTQPPVPPTGTPTSTPVAPPTPFPTSPDTSNGCCSLNYKDCVSWCGNTYESCMTCGNPEVIWLPNGEENRSCGERWSGCGENNDSNHSGCCDGLTCKWGDGYMMCSIGEGGPTAAPQSSPTSSNPTSVPQSSPVAAPPTGGGDLTTGKATFYGGNPSGGACGYNDLPQVTFPMGFSAAIGGDAFNDGYGCGSCYEITCVGPSGNNPSCFCGNSGKKTVVVQATDQCPECGSTHFDLNKEAFTSIVKDQDSGMAGTCGVLETQFRRVSCNFESNIKIRSKSGTSGFWYGLHIDDVAGYGAISSIKLREQGNSSFDIVCDKSQGASFWICHRPNNRQIFAPLDVHLTDSAGRTLTSNEVITNLDGGEEFDFGNNYGPISGDDSTPVATPTIVPAPPTSPPVTSPTEAPAPTIPFSGDLLSTDRAMNAWEIFQGLDALTFKKSDSTPKYAIVSSGGVAGDGQVVSEGQAYGLLITGTVLASWDTHASQVSGASRSEVLTYFEGYYNFWKEMCENSSSHNNNCQPNGNYCRSDGGSFACLPDWKHDKTGGSIATGPAPDADEDAIVGIMLAVKAVENDTNKPGWYEEARKWADASATAFFEFNVDNSRGDYRLVKLGSCWGGWESNGNNPSYHSPGSYRVMKDYQNSFPSNDRVGYTAVSQSEWTKLIDTSHKVLRAVQCSDNGALVPNWATIGVSGDSIIHSGGSFSGSGTGQYEYGAEAARTTFRVALDAAFYPDNSGEWSPYLSQYNYRMDDSFQNGSFSENTFPNCRSPNAKQDNYMFNSWQYNAFIYGPTYTALIAAGTDFGNAEAMIDAAGDILGELPDSYYARSWTMISNLMLNGAMESAGNTLRG